MTHSNRPAGRRPERGFRTTGLAGRSGVANQFSDGKRQLPDVSADADPWSGWAAYTDGGPGGRGHERGHAVLGGGDRADRSVRQAARGRPSGIRRPDALRDRRAPQRVPGFHDITVGATATTPPRGVGLRDRSRLA